MIKTLIQQLVRAKVRVDFNDFTRTVPASSVFGLDRGTPVDRYYIENFLHEHHALVQGRVLEIGDSIYSRRFGEGRVVSRDILHAAPGNAATTIIGDLTDHSTLPENLFDCFICTQTLNFIFEVQEAIDGAHRLLKPGGVLLATVAGISQISRYDMDRWGDYWRFTTKSVERLFTPVFGESVQIESHGNVIAATAFLQGVAVEDLPNPGLLDLHDPDYQLLISIVARKE